MITKENILIAINRRTSLSQEGYSRAAIVVRPASTSLVSSCPNLKSQHNNSVCLLADFGIAQNTAVKSDFPIIDGDKNYLSPELKTYNNPENPESLKKADIYAAGLIFMQLALGRSISP